MSPEPRATQGWYCEGEATGAQVTPCSPSNPIHDAPCGPIPPNEDIAEVLRRLNVARATVPAGGPTDRVLRQAHELISALRASSDYGVLWGDEDPIDEDDPEGRCSEQAQTWRHEIKGVITGVEVGGDDTWMMVRVVGDHRLRWLSPGRTQGGGEVTHDGEVGTYRRSRMVPIDARAGHGCPWQAQCIAPGPEGPPFECPDCPRLGPAAPATEEENSHWGWIVLTKNHSDDEGDFWLPDWDGQIHIDHNEALAAEAAAVLALGRSSVALIEAVSPSGGA